MAAFPQNKGQVVYIWGMRHLGREAIKVKGLSGSVVCMLCSTVCVLLL